MPDDPIFITSSPAAEIVFDRVVEIVALLDGTQAADPIVESSAFICAAVNVILASHGVEATRENQSRALRMVCKIISPAIEAEFPVKGGKRQ